MSLQKFEPPKAKKKGGTGEEPPKVSFWANENKLVNHVLGWAIDNVYGQIKRTSETKPLKKRVLKHGDEVEHVIGFIDSLYILHGDALSDDEYMKTCYSPADQIRNRGSLKLVAPVYFDFGRCLIREIKNFDRMVVQRKGKNSVKWAYDRMMQNISLKEQFLAITNTEDDSTSSNVCEATKIELYDSIITKTFQCALLRY